VRVLLDSGRWYGVKRTLSNTAKHTPTSKLCLALNRIRQRQQLPVRIYYTLSPMMQPVAEHHGRGRPLPLAIAALDVDAEHKQHVIGPEGYCKQCIAESTAKADDIDRQLRALGVPFSRVLSGSKGFHFYLLDETTGLVKQMPVADLQSLFQQLNDALGHPLTDNVNFHAKDGSFDLHRIFKLPGTVDAATGVLVQAEMERLSFNDTLEQVNFP
jgi:hypothetical protein